MRSLIVPFTVSDIEGRALSAGLTLASTFGGHLDAVFAQPARRVSLPMMEEGVGSRVQRDILERLSVERGETAERARARFLELIAQYQASEGEPPAAGARASASWRVVEGDLAELVRGRGAVYDAIVLARPGEKADEDWDAAVEASLFATGRSLLLVPPGPLSRFGETILVGWNRTAQSGRALHAALPLLARARKAVVLSVVTNRKQGPDAADAARYLDRHGVAAEVREVAPDRRSVGETLLAEAHAQGADLVVMGAYSHSRFREMILGGVTRHMLAASGLPLLMAH